MRSVNIHEAKTHLSALVEEVLAGEEIVLARRGVPLIRFVSVHPPKQRVFGLGKHFLPEGVPEDFDAPDLEIEAQFSGGN